MSNIVDARRTLVARILEGEGRASPALRRAAFDNAGLAEAVATLVEKVAKHANTVIDQDIAATRAAGLTDDQIFEVVVCGAVGQAVRQHETALAALDLAVGKG
jgi:alkylhydroperoxidase family enzyme